MKTHELSIEKQSPMDVMERVIESKVKIETRPILGRVLIASEEIAAGDVIIKESPILTWDTNYDALGNELASIDGKSTYNDISSFLDAYLKLSATDQEEILAMKSFESPLESNIESLIKGQIKDNFPTLSESFVRQLLSIVATNSHQYYGRMDHQQSVDVTQKHPTLNQSALFAVGSKATHSCDPNCIYTSKLGPFLAYRALKPIHVGDLITFSYIADRLITPRIDRRCILLQTKNFVCQCDRCIGIDDNRGLKCRFTKCKGTMYQGDDSVWSCRTCKKTCSSKEMKDNLACEEKLKEKFVSLEKSLLVNATLSKIKPNDFESLIVEISTKLSPTHYLVAKAYQYYVRWLAGQAKTVKQVCQMMSRDSVPSPWGAFVSVRELYQMAGKAGAMAIKIKECINSRCDKGRECQESHLACNENVTDALWAIDDLVQSDMKESIAQAKLLASKYQPLFKIQFGDNDKDVLRIQKLIDAEENATDVKFRCHYSFCYSTSNEPMNLCSSCRSVQYCSRECQRKDWPEHKKSCVKKI